MRYSGWRDRVRVPNCGWSGQQHPTSSRAGGFIFAEDPLCPAWGALPLWSAAADPAVLQATTTRPTGNTALSAELLRHHDWRIARGTNDHLVLDVGSFALRIDIAGGNVLAAPRDLSFHLGPARGWRDRLPRIRSILSAAEAGRAILPPPPEPGLWRAIMALRTLDALAAGASLQTIARDLLEIDDWPGPGESAKSRARRLVSRAGRLRDGGSLAVLAGRL
ncbi:DUF2285 domain-containing protein [Sphingomonas sp.]|uniref:DNA -binding domain-containing protein n=1 Tax=Sphingomonas sp. TaxID=28214 RepID=UPI0025F21483|nr:DUF2285 domain-containing protein [Sphingomonas sp.]